MGAVGLLVAALIIALFVVIERVGAKPSPDDVRVTVGKTSAVATWDRQSSSTFRVEYSTKLDFSDAEAQEVSDNTLSMESLTPATTYYLRVTALDDGGEEGSPSRRVRFTTKYPVAAPKLKIPYTMSTTITARWSSEVKRKARYEVHFGTDVDFAEPVVIRTVKNAKKLGTLAPSTLYAVRVRVVDAQGDPLSAWSKTERSKTAAYEPMGVGTYNVLKWRKGNWSARRGAVVELIKNSHLDVVGLQEAVPSYVPGGPPQFQDIANHLGKDWAVTRSNKRGATGETRTVYDTTKLKQVAEGYHAMAGSARFRGTTRYLAWSVFEQRSTGKQFIFANTHFTPGRSGSVRAQRASEARQAVAALKAINRDGLPVIFVGDFNGAGYRNKSNAIYATITGAGYIDPLVRAKRRLGAAEKVVDGNLTTSNGLNRTAPRRSNPPFLDHIFVSPMRVSQWQVAAKLDSAGRFIGTIPSDHNLVRATVYLP